MGTKMLEDMTLPELHVEMAARMAHYHEACEEVLNRRTESAKNTWLTGDILVAELKQVFDRMRWTLTDQITHRRNDAERLEIGMGKYVILIPMEDLDRSLDAISRDYLESFARAVMKGEGHHGT